MLGEANLSLLLLVVVGFVVGVGDGGGGGDFAVVVGRVVVSSLS